MRPAAWLLILTAAVVAGRSAAGQDAPFIERVEVVRVLVDVRVLDDSGAPVLGLGPSDFEVTIGGRPVRVESAEWVGQDPASIRDPEELWPLESARPGAAAGTQREPSGRLIVFLVQKDLEPRRVAGLMRLSSLADHLLAPLTAEDRVAILSFDSRLRIWSDFTNDFARVRSILRDDMLVRRPGPVEASEGVSLLPRLDERTAARTAGIERALLHIAESLEPLPGAKSLVLIGYGFGRFSSSGVILMDGYDAAAVALKRARVSVFTLNVTQADFNSLQAGLQSVSAETGGIYESLFHFPVLAIRRVANALSGHYVLFVEKPVLPSGTHRIEVRLPSGRGRIVAARGFVLAP